MLDELPSLELAASAIALVLVLRVSVLLRRDGLSRQRGRAESGRARDLIGLAVLVGAVLYALRVQRASTWFLIASGIAIVAQLVGFYLRASARKSASNAQGVAAPGLEPDEDDNEEDDEEVGRCSSCGNAELIELVDTRRLLGGLSQLTPVSALVCPSCGALSGQVEDPGKIAVGAEHGTALRRAAGTEQEPLEEPTEHDG